MNEKLESTSWTRVKEGGGWVLAVVSFIVISGVLVRLAKSRLSFHSIESFKRSWSYHFQLDEGTMVNDKVMILFGAFFAALLLFTWGFTLVKKYYKVNKVWQRTQKEKKLLATLDCFEEVTLHAVGASKFDNDLAFYSYLEFKDVEGRIQSYSKDKIVITAKMNVNFEPGAKGDFYFGKIFGANFLVASNIQGEKRSLDISEYGSNIISLYFVHLMSYGVVGVFVFTIFTMGFFLVVPLIQAARTASKHAATKKAMRALAF